MAELQPESEGEDPAHPSLRAAVEQSRADLAELRDPVEDIVGPLEAVGPDAQALEDLTSRFDSCDSPTAEPHHYRPTVFDAAGNSATDTVIVTVEHAAPVGLEAHWTFDEGSGPAAGDSSGNGNAAALNGATWGAGVAGGALSFNGSGAYLDRADADLAGVLPARSSGAAADFTLSAWVKLNATGDRNPILSKQGTSAPGSVRGYGWYATRYDGSGRVEFELFTSDASSTSVISTQALTAGTWYHLAVSYEFVSNGTSVVRIYIDGIEDAVSTTAVGPLQGNGQPLDIGRYWWSGGYSRYMNGSIDDLRVYSRALSAAEIAALSAGAP